MELRIFTLPYDEVTEGFPDEIIQQFCSNKKVHSIQTNFFMQEGSPFWSVAVQYETVVKGEDKILALDKEQQVLYERLRVWRKETGFKQGIPVYLIATNAQLLKTIQLRCRTLESLKSVKGFGKKRIDKYGRELTKIIQDFFTAEKRKAEKAAAAESDTSIIDLPFD